MAAPPLSDEVLRETLRFVEQYGTVTDAARAAGVSRETFQSRYNKARLRRDLRLGAEIDNRIADGYEPTGYSQLTKTAAGEPIWLKTRRAERDYWQGVTAAIQALEPVDTSIIPLPPEPSGDIVPWLQIGDAHIGMLACETETGANFDIAIAEREICAAAAMLIDAAPYCERMVINDLGDATHYENFRGETEASGHAVDYDTRFWKMVRAYIRITRFIIERALTRAAKVDYITSQGNHSRTNDIWISAMVEALYSDGGRVTVLRNETPFIAYRMGKTLVMIHHGDKAKPARLRDIMAHDWAADWGESHFRYIDGGHVHSSRREELAGAVFESWNNLAPRDKWAHDSGYRSKQSMSMVYRSRTYGEIGRQLLPVEKVRDAVQAAHPTHYIPPTARAFAA